MVEETTIEQVEFAIKQSREGEDATFYGYAPFVYLLKESRLRPSKTDGIAVHPYRHDGTPQYTVTREGKLEKVVREGERPTIHDPKEVLSLQNAPGGWEPIGQYWCWDSKKILPFKVNTHNRT